MTKYSPKKETLKFFRIPGGGTLWVLTASLETSMDTPVDSIRAALSLAVTLFPNDGGSF